MCLWKRAATAICSAFIVVTQPSQASMSPSLAAVNSCMVHAAATLGFNGTVYARQGAAFVERHFGTSDIDSQIPISSETRFNIGSAGKMFTAVAVGLLVDRHDVDLEAPIGRFLDGLEPPLAAVTISQLLSHTSGLGNYLDPRNKVRIESATTATELLPLAIAAPLAFQPGHRRAYSNSGFVVLGAIIEKVSGVSYARFVEQEILSPLGMTHTRLDAPGSAAPMTNMSPQGLMSHAQLSPLRLEHASPAGGMFSTAADMSLFLTAMQEGRVLSRATLEGLLTPRLDAADPDATYALGFVVRRRPRVAVGHGGGAPGVNAEVEFFPDSGWQLIALSNNDPPIATRMVEVLEDVAFADDPASACAGAVANAVRARTRGRVVEPARPHIQ